MRYIEIQNGKRIISIDNIVEVRKPQDSRNNNLQIVKLTPGGDRTYDYFYGQDVIKCLEGDYNKIKNILLNGEYVHLKDGVAKRKDIMAVYFNDRDTLSIKVVIRKEIGGEEALLNQYSSNERDLYNRDKTILGEI